MISVCVSSPNGDSATCPDLHIDIPLTPACFDCRAPHVEGLGIFFYGAQKAPGGWSTLTVNQQNNIFGGQS